MSSIFLLFNLRMMAIGKLCMYVKNNKVIWKIYQQMSGVGQNVNEHKIISMYMVKRAGPRTEPLGTPEFKCGNKGITCHTDRQVGKYYKS